MSISFITQHREASEALTAGLRDIERYYENRQIPELEAAMQHIDTAISKDGNYGPAIYYKGVVLDLIGQPADAPAFFERIRRDCKGDDLKLEATFNLGVVYYHQYSHSKLEIAEHHFKEVIERSAQQDLRQLAQAHLAQTYAMWMRPSQGQNDQLIEGQRDQVIEHIKTKFQACQDIVKALKQALSRPDSVSASMHNADGMSKMYYTDHVVRDFKERRALLTEAKKALTETELFASRDWANNCDLGSVELRLGALALEERGDQKSADRHFSEAKKRLFQVIDDLRPEYGFALYELAILHRVWKKTGEALAYLQRAKRVPEKYRDVSDGSVDLEIARINKNDSAYP